jgi:hemerythrin
VCPISKRSRYNSIFLIEDRRRIKDVLDNIIDYTQSHFTFEESLQEEADYKYRVL